MEKGPAAMWTHTGERTLRDRYPESIGRYVHMLCESYATSILLGVTLITYAHLFLFLIYPFEMSELH